MIEVTEWRRAVAEKKEGVGVTVWLAREVLAAVEARAKQEDRTRSHVLRRLVEWALEQQGIYPPAGPATYEATFPMAEKFRTLAPAAVTGLTTPAQKTGAGSGTAVPAPRRTVVVPTAALRQAASQPNPFIIVECSCGQKNSVVPGRKKKCVKCGEELTS